MKTMPNLHLIDQPRWRAWLVAWFARILGVCIHVEGIPLGSNRARRIKTQRGMAQQASGESPAG